MLTILAIHSLFTLQAAETVSEVADLVVPDITSFAAETIEDILYQAQCDEADMEREAQIARINTERMEATDLHLQDYYAEIKNRVLLTYNEEQAFMMEAEHAQKLSDVLAGFDRKKREIEAQARPTDLSKRETNEDLDPVDERGRHVTPGDEFFDILQGISDEMIKKPQQEDGQQEKNLEGKRNERIVDDVVDSLIKSVFKIGNDRAFTKHSIQMTQMRRCLTLT